MKTFMYILGFIFLCLIIAKYSVFVLAIILAILFGLWLTSKPPKALFIFILISSTMLACEDNIECDTVYLEGNSKMHCIMK